MTVRENQISKFLVVTEAQEASSSLGEKIPWGNRPGPTLPFSEKQQAQGEGTFVIRHYKNQDQTGRNCRVALTLDLKFQVSLKLVQNIFQVVQQTTYQLLLSSNMVSRCDSCHKLLVPCPCCYKKRPEQTSATLQTGGSVL